MLTRKFISKCYHKLHNNDNYLADRFAYYCKQIRASFIA